MTDTNKRYVKFYTKSGRCILEINSTHIVDISVVSDSNYKYQQYRGGKKFRLTRESYYLRSMEIVFCPCDEIDFVVWWNNHYQYMQNLGWVDIDISSRCILRYIFKDTKTNVHYEHSDTCNESIITIEGVKDEYEKQNV